MKNMIIGFLLCFSLILTAGVVENWGRSFSPRQTAAIALVSLDEANKVRDWLGKPTVTTNRYVQELTAKYKELSDEFRALENPVWP